MCVCISNCARETVCSSQSNPKRISIRSHLQLSSRWLLARQLSCPIASVVPVSPGDPKILKTPILTVMSAELAEASRAPSCLHASGELLHAPDNRDGRRAGVCKNGRCGVGVARLMGVFTGSPRVRRLHFLAYDVAAGLILISPSPKLFKHR
jgi:hypothetical protein